jgi:hypothetical protein
MPMSSRPHPPIRWRSRSRWAAAVPPDPSPIQARARWPGQTDTFASAGKARPQSVTFTGGRLRHASSAGSPSMSDRLVSLGGRWRLPYLAGSARAGRPGHPPRSCRASRRKRAQLGPDIPTGLCALADGQAWVTLASAPWARSSWRRLAAARQQVRSCQAGFGRGPGRAGEDIGGWDLRLGVLRVEQVERVASQGGGRRERSG